MCFSAHSPFNSFYYFVYYFILLLLFLFYYYYYYILFYFYLFIFLFSLSSLLSPLSFLFLLPNHPTHSFSLLPYPSPPATISSLLFYFLFIFIFFSFFPHFFPNFSHTLSLPIFSRDNCVFNHIGLIIKVRSSNHP